MECPRCNKPTEPTIEFYYPSQLSGRSGNNWCKSCLRSYNKENRHKYRARDRAYNQERYRSGLDVDYRKRWKEERYERLNTYKESHPCMDCRQPFPAVCMDFHHRDPTTKIADVAVLIGAKKKSWEIIEAEINKCDLICSNCHRIRTANHNKTRTTPYHRSTLLTGEDTLATVISIS